MIARLAYVRGDIHFIHPNHAASESRFAKNPPNNIKGITKIGAIMVAVA
jgi:hypothetical protein